jgi:hypothetical protein
MRVTILGATGFIGRHLGAALRARGDDVVEASLRDPAKAAEASAGSEVVVNLAGSPVAVRWTETSKRAMTTSRVDLPHAYLDALASVEGRPKAYVGGSAIGYYGCRRTDVPFEESSPPGDDFLARLCVAWEAEADRAGTLGMRVAKIRTGLVLGRDGGVLDKLLPLFRLGLGGVVASGGQWYSWIHVDDEVGVLLHAIDGAEGVLNATAPNPVTNRDFTHALGRAVHRPTIFPVPAFAAALMLGEGGTVLTEGQRVVPRRTVESGYVFRHQALDEALQSLMA